MITVVTLLVLTIMAVSYLFMLQNDNRFVARDQAWNRALSVAEAGIEEGMAYVNRGGLAATPQPYTNAWVSMPRTNLYGGSYSVVLSGTTNVVTITSTGMVTAPLSSTKLWRVVQVTALFTSGYQVGIAAITSITDKGNNITVDSYDSSNTNLFPGGLYNTSNRMDHGDIASLQISSNAISVGNANIAGKVHLPPGGTQYDVNLGPNGAVGTVAWAIGGGGTGFEGGNPSPYFADDFNLSFPDVSAPYTSGTGLSQPGNGATNTVSTGTYYVNGNYSIPNKAVLDISAYSYVVLYVHGTFGMNSGGLINIEPGATLVLYVDGSSSTFSQINNGGNANNFQYFGLPSNTSITMGGNAQYIGTIYAPEASITLNGGGNNVLDYQGAMIVNSLTANGKFNLHYDENLAREPLNGTFIPTNWVELASSVH